MAIITARYSGRCTKCGGKISAGERILYAGKHITSHVTCPENPTPAPATSRRGVRKCATCGQKINYGTYCGKCEFSR